MGIYINVVVCIFKYILMVVPITWLCSFGHVYLICYYIDMGTCNLQLHKQNCIKIKPDDDR